MQYANDLIAQAQDLISAGRGRPKQVNLRRAVSSAYYALFHEVVDQAVFLLIPPKPIELRQQARRTPTHTGIQKLCEAIGRGQLKLKGKPVGESFSDELTRFARTFVLLQDSRHEADFDLAGTFDRPRTATLVEEVNQALSVLQALPASDGRNAFLSLVLLGSNRDV